MKLKIEPYFKEQAVGQFRTNIVERGVVSNEKTVPCMSDDNLALHEYQERSERRR